MQIISTCLLTYVVKTKVPRFVNSTRYIRLPCVTLIDLNKSCYWLYNNLVMLNDFQQKNVKKNRYK